MVSFSKKLPSNYLDQFSQVDSCGFMLDQKIQAGIIAIHLRAFSMYWTVGRLNQSLTGRKMDFNHEKRLVFLLLCLWKSTLDYGIGCHDSNTRHSARLYWFLQSDSYFRSPAITWLEASSKANQTLSSIRPKSLRYDAESAATWRHGDMA